MPTSKIVVMAVCEHHSGEHGRDQHTEGTQKSLHHRGSIRNEERDDGHYKRSYQVITTLKAMVKEGAVKACTDD